MNSASGRYRQYEDSNMNTKKQEKVKTLLRQASNYMFAERYDRAIFFYEEALRQIYLENYNFTDLDICIIEYALSKCYSTNKMYFTFASNNMIPLVVSHGPLFPTLYYGLAKLCFNQSLFVPVVSVINNGLATLRNIGDRDSIIANWPATNIQIPETDYDKLMEMLTALKAVSQDKEGTVEEDKVENSDYGCEYSTDCYLSDETSSERDEIQPCTSDATQNMPTTTSELAYKNDNPTEDGTESKVTESDNLDKSDIVEEEIATEVQDAPLTTFDDEKEIIKEVKKCESTWKIDAAEFVPRNKSYVMSNNVDIIPEVLMYDNMYQPVEHQDNFPPITETEMVDKSVQATIELTDAVMQTLSIEKEIQDFENLEPNEQTSEMLLLHEENKKLQQKVHDLQNELYTFHQQSFDNQQKQLTENKNAMKLEIRLEDLKEKVRTLDSQNKMQEQKLRFIHSVLTAESMQYFSLQKFNITNHIRKCSMMINDLSAVSSYLTPTSVPTLADCHRSIDQWKIELQRTEQCLISFQECYHRITNDIAVGNFRTIQDHRELCMYLNEPRDILHDHFTLALSTVLKDNVQLHQQCMTLQQQQYYQGWNNYARQQQLLRPIYANSPPQLVPVQSSPRLQIVNAPTTSNVSNRVEICDASAQQNTKNQDAIINKTDNQNSWEDEPVANSDNAKPKKACESPTSSLPHQDEDISNSNEKQSVPPSKIKSSTLKKIPQSWLDEIQVTSSAADVSVKSDLLSKSAEIGASAKELIHPSTSKSKASIDWWVSKQAQTSEDNAVAQPTEINLGVPKPRKPLTTENLTAHNNCVQEASSMLDTNLKGNEVTEKNLTVSWEDTGSPESSVSSTLVSEQNYSLQTNHSNQGNRFMNVQATDSFSYNLKVNDNTITTSQSSQDKLIQGTSAIFKRTFASVTSQETKDNSSIKSPKNGKSVEGPNFSGLVNYIKNKIPEASEAELVAAVKIVRKKNSRLTGMTKPTIVAAVQAELNSMRHGRDVTEATSSIGNSTFNKSCPKITCIICIQLFGESPVTALHCKHTFHKHCLRRWFETNNTCPVCRIYAI